MDVRNPTLKTMYEQGVVAVLRSKSVEQALAVADACLAGDLACIEVTFSVPEADKAIEALQKTDGIIGAGTVLTDDQARLALDAGARFLVAPTFNPQIAEICTEADIPYVPGCMTVNEMYTATQAGCEVVKLFPASEYTPGFIKALKAPLPDLRIMPTGGVSLDNTAAWMAAGAFAVGVGGNLTKVVDDDYQAITDAAQAYRKQVEAGRAQ
ncbi:MAG: bifunctional 4-hydroxy-2-oxoglutarate aldolase/2-dehydro-3-deoxy-phosphogluconate aldolase [Coriobacteriaceae bacterium]|nr:bifunctional 4-hydroxy-2-oxoglutarate aldolase/2-dehydro-3-deoxy-phosphogluconate aldolase [Coriobacteriaceae bacterium]